ncbi:hypothetical protein [Aquibacillus rhizosphaerae]|uniref:Uncharacterized protein n=1 Tax=Aquibacillus rhizosphaerae TaxID=3051431 RepID=A0ABT7LAR9_9BACI|nr:hypothetical protein [Aquibacillus sp. LR5S19]MDL4842951.1 hypothetical protein [Aquibacillus sp. LR5S19]
MSKKSYFFLIVGLIIVIFWYVFNYGLPWNYMEAKRSFQSHLASYDEELVLGSVEYDFIHSSYTGSAYEKENPDIRFYIGESLYSGAIEDTYKLEKMHDQATQDLIDILNQYLPNRLSESVEIVKIEDKELEVHISVNEEVEMDVKNAIIADLYDKGYVTKQFLINIED